MNDVQQGLHGTSYNGKVERFTADGRTYRLALTKSEQLWFKQHTGTMFNAS